MDPTVVLSVLLVEVLMVLAALVVGLGSYCRPQRPSDSYFDGIGSSGWEVLDSALVLGNKVLDPAIVLIVLLLHILMVVVASGSRSSIREWF